MKLIRDLIGLEAAVREVHWNVSGPGFIYIHKYLDEVYDSCEEYLDEVAEHYVAFNCGVPVWDTPSVDHFDGGYIKEGVEHLLQKIGVVLSTISSQLDVKQHPEYEDILVRLSQDMHKHKWFLSREIE